MPPIDPADREASRLGSCWTSCREACDGRSGEASDQGWPDETWTSAVRLPNGSERPAPEFTGLVSREIFV